jgi:xanthine dehydrogenase molybdopterin-binding subunit B
VKINDIYEINKAPRDRFTHLQFFTKGRCDDEFCFEVVYQETKVSLHFTLINLPNISLSQKTVSSTLNIPINRITCHVKRVGGGFGGKVGRPAAFGAIAAVGATK